MFLRLINGIQSLLPSQCTVCHSWPNRTVCAACVERFAQPVPRCLTCALTVLAGMRQCGRCIAKPPPLDRAIAAVGYVFPWSNQIQDFKFHRNTAGAHFMANLMRSVPWVEPALETAQWLIPVPLSLERMRERGFNQALLLARALDRAKTQAGTLLRIQHSAAQSSLSRKERIENLNSAFALEPSKHADVEGKRIVLVDDVMTTGATLHAAARVLRSAGAAHITALVFARTE